MSTIRILKKIESETMYLPELKPLIGKTVEIIVKEQPAVVSATEKDWEDFFADEGPVSVDPDLYKRYREFDRRHHIAPDL